ncbi:MAG TPA: hypothetical protein VIG45_01400 [Erysipelothrix sp.]
MTARIPESTIDKAENLYNSGKSLREISKLVGRGEEALRKHLKNRGIEIKKTSTGRVAPNAILNLPEDHICADYLQGNSENAISKTYGVSRGVIRRILKNHNIKIRSQSESETLKWSRMSIDQRENQVKKAHISARGRVKTDEEKRKTAISREINTPDWYIGCGEPEFKKWLDNEGIEYKYQKAVEFYNIDFLIDGIAVELTSFVGRNRLTRSDFMSRADILNKQGIKTLAVEFKNEAELISHAYDVINMANKLRSNHLDAYYVAYRLQFSEPDIRILA